MDRDDFTRRGEPVGVREFVALSLIVDRHDNEIRELQLAKAQARGAAREGARFASWVVGGVGVVGMLGQLALTFFRAGGHG